MSDGHEHALTAFIVVVPADGGPAYATTNFDHAFQIQRVATPADIRRGAHDVVDDLNARAAAEYTNAGFPTPPTED